MHKRLKKGLKKAEKEIQEFKKIYLERQNIKTLVLLIALSSLFCLRAWEAQMNLETGESIKIVNEEDAWIEKSVTGSQKISLSKNYSKRQDVLRQFSDYYLPIKEEKENFNKSDFENELLEIVGNAPIAKMISHISLFDRQTAGFIIGIAKKESDWGKRAPSKNGVDCFNYWGYKGSGGNGTAMGYACFASAEEAVKTVGKRIEHFVGKNLNTPSKMVVWKCGSSCSWDNPANVRKWISDVSKYYNQIAYVK